MKLSVIMITYGHEKYIIEAINGVLMQKCDFDFELIIANDCSPDSTHNIVQEFMRTLPNSNLIKYTRHSINLGPLKNSIGALNQSNAEYIALCEGDDYWTDPLKLQKQVDFLEKNNDFSICFTDYKVFNENSNLFSYPNLIDKFKNKSVFKKSNIILSNFIPTATVMFKARKEVFCKLDPNLFPGDWFLHILNSEYGKIKFLPFESTVYRKHDGGICSATSPILNNQKYLKSIKIFRKGYSKLFKVQCLFNLVIFKIRLQNIKFRLLGI